MYFSNTILTALAATSIASSIVPDLNHTELTAVIAGAGPVIMQTVTATVTVTEHLSMLSPTTKPSYWQLTTFFLTRIRVSSAASHEQMSSKQNTHICPGFHLPSSHAFRNHHGPNCAHMTEKQISSASSADASTSKPTTSTELSQTTMNPTAKLWSDANRVKNHLKRHVAGFEDYPLAIRPTWTMATRKWHGPFSRPKSTATFTATIEKETIAAEEGPVSITSLLKT